MFERLRRYGEKQYTEMLCFVIPVETRVPPFLDGARAIFIN